MVTRTPKPGEVSEAQLFSPGAHKARANACFVLNTDVEPKRESVNSISALGDAVFTYENLKYFSTNLGVSSSNLFGCAIHFAFPA
jgi:hypothetical protein